MGAATLLLGRNCSLVFRGRPSDYHLDLSAGRDARANFIYPQGFGIPLRTENGKVKTENGKFTVLLKRSRGVGRII